MDYLDQLAQSTIELIEGGYYTNVADITVKVRPSFIESIQQAQAQGKNALIAEIKPASPSAGRLLHHENIREILQCYRESGVAGISVLTEPRHFGGSLEYLKCASETGLPTLMKDFLMDPAQMDACMACGGSAALLILTLFRRGYSKLALDEMIAEAHRRDLEVLLEVNSWEEFEQAQRTQADMIGINNRDLATLKVDLNTTEKILRQATKDGLIWSLSGIDGAEDLRRLKSAGTDAFLVGTALMRAVNLKAKLQELMEL